MGMFDDVICNAKLPGTPPSFVRPGSRFQTKDFDCELRTYTITEDGRLLGPGGEEIAYDGVVNFYDSNWSGIAAGVYFTRDGEDFQSCEYDATFAGGRLQSIREVRREARPALPIGRMHIEAKPTDAEIDAHKARRAESLVGRAMHLRYGGDRAGDDVEVIAENDRQWVARKPDGLFKVIDRNERDLTFFASAAEADARHGAEVSDGERIRSEYDALLARRGGEGA